MTLITCERVEHCYHTRRFFNRRPPRQVLNGVDLSLDDGECLALLGMSGSGKSTLGRIILGLEPPAAGCARFRSRPVGEWIRADRQTFRRNVQVVFQDSVSAVDPRFTVGRIVEEPLRHLTSLDAAARARRRRRRWR